MCREPICRIHFVEKNSSNWTSLFYKLDSRNWFSTNGFHTISYSSAHCRCEFLGTQKFFIISSSYIMILTSNIHEEIGKFWVLRNEKLTTALSLTMELESGRLLLTRAREGHKGFPAATEYPACYTWQSCAALHQRSSEEGFCLYP